MTEHWLRVPTLEAITLICDEGSLPASMFSEAVLRDLCERGKVARVEEGRVSPEPHAHRLADFWREAQEVMRAVSHE